MRDTKLVLIEGFPGSGKSMAARYLAGSLRQCGVAVHCYEETQSDHPLKVGGPLHPSGATTGEELFRRYSVESFVDESLRCWRAFVLSTAQAQAVNIVESYPYQSTARVLLQMDADPDRIREYAREVESLILPLAPELVYFDSGDAAAAVRAVGQVRGAAWTAYAIAVVTRCPYCWRRGLNGADGAVALFDAYTKLVGELLVESRLPRLSLASCWGQWETCYQQILTFLGLPGTA